MKGGDDRQSPETKGKIVAGPPQEEGGPCRGCLVGETVSPAHAQHPAPRHHHFPFSSPADCWAATPQIASGRGKRRMAHRPVPAPAPGRGETWGSLAGPRPEPGTHGPACQGRADPEGSAARPPPVPAPLGPPHGPGSTRALPPPGRVGAAPPPPHTQTFGSRSALRLEAPSATAEPPTPPSRSPSRPRGS